MRYLQMDVFANRFGGGNPLGVVIGAEHWPDTTMQQFAAWTNLVETTYILPATDAQADYRLRIFTPRMEIPFAGHPTLGSAHAALECGLVQPREGRLTQECEAGLLPIRVMEGEPRELFLHTPAVEVLPAAREALQQLDAIIAGQPRGTLPPALVAGGRHWWVAELADEATVRNWTPDFSRIAALAQATDTLGICVFARTSHKDYDVVVRAFPCGVGIDEDPASGAANGLIASYIALAEPHGSLGRGYRVSQGREIERDARIVIHIESDASVWVGGTTNLVIDGTLNWPKDRA